MPTAQPACLRPVLALALALAAAACSRPPPLMADAAALAEAQRALAALPEFARRPPQVHAAALFHDDDIEIALVDPADEAKLHTYRYLHGRWQREGSMEHTCALLQRLPQQQSDDLPLARIDFATVARVRANWYERARSVPGALADPEHDRLPAVWFYTHDYSAHEGGAGERSAQDGSAGEDAARSGGERDGASRGQWSTGPISGEGGAGYRIGFAIDGSVRRFERLR